MSDSFVVSYDLGTSGVKIALVNSKGELITSETVNYPLITPNPGWAEQRPEDYWNAVCTGTGKLTVKAGISRESVIGIAFGTQWKGIIPVDSGGKVLHNAIIWLDGRASRQADELNRRLNTDIFTERDYWAKLLWVKEELPEVYEKTESFLEVNSFLKFRATGIKTVDLSNNFVYSPKKEIDAFYKKIMDAAGLDLDKFPPLVMPSEKAGELTSEAAECLGLEKGTPVFGGSGDIPAIAVGAGCSGPGRSHIYLGSSGWLGVSVEERIEGAGELYQSFDRDKELLLYVMQSACMAQNWAVDQFYHVERNILKEEIFGFLDRDLEDVPPGSLNLVATPWLHGELPPLSGDARMVFVNISNGHDRRHMVNAVREGICFSIRWKIEVYRQETGNKLDSIRVVGGGASSAKWMQSLSDILGIPVIIPRNARHAGAVGTAFCAIVGSGICGSFEEADKLIGIEKTYEPRGEFSGMYGKLYGVYKNLYPSLKDSFKTLSG